MTVIRSPDVPIADTIYQWVTIQEEFVCVNFNKFAKEKEQISYDQGVTWEDTGKTRQGELIETESEDCGYNVILYRFEDDDVLFEMYQPCIRDNGRSALNIRVWNKTENNTIRMALYEQGAYSRGYAETPPQTDETYTYVFSCSTFNSSYRYFIKVSTMGQPLDPWDGELKYQTGYFSFMCNQIINQCGY